MTAPMFTSPICANQGADYTGLVSIQGDDVRQYDYPDWMSPGLDSLYAEALKLTAAIPWEAKVHIYLSGYKCGELRGQR